MIPIWIFLLLVIYGLSIIFSTLYIVYKLEQKEKSFTQYLKKLLKRVQE